jgi:hypothetical protein
LTEATFDEMNLIMGNRANVKPPLLFNRVNTGYSAADTGSASPVKDGDESIQNADKTDAEGSQRGKKKRITRTNSNEILEALKPKWEKDEEAEAITQGRNEEARERHLSIMGSVAASFKNMAEKRN